MRLEIDLIPAAQRLLALHAAELPQKDELCGAFWGLLALRSASVESYNGQSLDQDEVGASAGAAVSRAGGDAYLPPGAAGRADYRIDLPRLVDGELAGISSTGLARAVAELSSQDLAVLPVSGPWTAASVTELMSIATTGDDVVCPIANLATAPLWPSRVALQDALRYLTEGVDLDLKAEWDVGHFVGLLGQVRGPARSLAVVADTYPSLGLDGVHLQPAERVATALARPDGRGGGVLLVVAAGAEQRVSAALDAAGLGLGPWDNGSLDLREDGVEA